MYDFDKNGTMSFKGNSIFKISIFFGSIYFLNFDLSYYLFPNPEFVELNKFLLKVSSIT